MRLFIAAKFETRARLRPFRDALNAMGHTVIARWLDEPNEYGYPSDACWLSRSDLDIEDVTKVEGIILDTTVESTTGGREVEYGVAVRDGLELFLVGPRRNVHHFRFQNSFASWQDALWYFYGRRACAS